MKLKPALLICTAMLWPVEANAAPVLGFFAGITGLGGPFLGSFLGTGFLGGAYAVGAFLGSTVIGNLILNLGLSALLTPKAKAPTIAEARVNTRLAIAPRWQLAGKVIAGGELGTFAEYDEVGNFWFIVAHGDAELTGVPQYYLDGRPVTLATITGGGFVSGDVLTDDFCLNNDDAPYEGTGVKVPVFRIYTVTPTSTATFGPLPADFTAAFTSLDSDFRLAGVCFSVVRCKSVEPANYGSAYRWRGGFGLGEPSVAVAANWNRMYDPRNPAHDINSRLTWTPSDGNPAIVWAWFRTAPYGRRRPMSEVNWEQVAIEADACDVTVLDRSGVPTPLYRCGMAFPDNKPRHECEAEILLTADAFVVYDDQGKAYPSVGRYVAPTLTFNAARDILSSQTVTVDDGEAAVDGVVVTYVSPAHDYAKVQAAPWKNPAYYDVSLEPNYLQIEILGCQNHNQAVRLAKAIGLRAGSTQKAGLQTTLKGMLAQGVRTIGLDLDDQFSGDYEIMTPPEESEDGSTVSFAVVPMQVDRYTLNAGEEGEPPELAPDLELDTALEVATGVVLTAERVATESGNAVRLFATFNDPVRLDRAFKFRYALTGQTVYRYFTTDMRENFAYSALVTDGASYDVQWQTLTGSGRQGAWSAITMIAAVANPTAPLALVSASAAGGAGQATGTFTTANDANQKSVAIFHNTTTTFGTATLGAVKIAAANVSSTILATGLTPGVRYIWMAPRNGSGVQGTPSGPFTVTIT